MCCGVVIFVFKLMNMVHILDCTNEELLSFEITKEYKGHLVRVKPIIDKPKNTMFVFGGESIILSNGFEVSRQLHVLFQMFNGFEVDLGIIVQEMVEDTIEFNYWIDERLKYIGQFLNNI